MGLGDKNSHQPTILMTNPSIKVLMSGSRNIVWTPERHIYFSESFQKCVLGFLLCLKKIQKTTKIKIPKFVLFEIVKEIVKYY